MAEFFHMGGYAPFIWPSFALWALVMTGLALWGLADKRRQMAKAKELEEKLGGRRRVSGSMAPGPGAANSGETGGR
ncbi:heme exporter protein CcmD [Tepidicaulis marinus]|jgi:heme exporter protein D|uniref:Heme exporter protein D n=1 Tax=Tepidicaulis marinus TaxID=1333998 RepID=A0A081B885_9HYPH|nr:heme exporter protein CcmD [Tepidicaulis marinus]GAK44253.1 heme exporter protein CcmD [Tepidicaulis marinus]